MPFRPPIIVVFPDQFEETARGVHVNRTCDGRLSLAEYGQTFENQEKIKFIARKPGESQDDVAERAQKRFVLPDCNLPLMLMHLEADEELPDFGI